MEHLPALIAALPGDPAHAAPQTRFTREAQVAFLRALAECGAVRRASAGAGISYRTAYRERRTSRAFRLAWDAALLSARALGEDVLATRALDGVEEVVFYRGEEVGRRRRYDSRLLLAHLARLDRLTEDARTRAFADDFEGAMERFEAGADDPAPVCADCGEALPAPAHEPGPVPEAAGEGAPARFSPGLCDKCDISPPQAAAPMPAPAPEPAPVAEPTAEDCPECGGCCLDPDPAIAASDCPVFEERVAAMYEARPDDAPWPEEIPGHAAAALEAIQLEAWEAGVARWWLVVPPLPGEDPDVWHRFEPAGAAPAGAVAAP